MNKYEYVIQTTITETIHVMANDEDEAYELAHNVYDSGTDYSMAHSDAIVSKVVDHETIDSREVKE